MRSGVCLFSRRTPPSFYPPTPKASIAPPDEGSQKTTATGAAATQSFAVVAPLRAASRIEASALLSLLPFATSCPTYIGLLLDYEEEDNDTYGLLDASSSPSLFHVQPFFSDASTASIWQAVGQQAFHDGADCVVFCHSAAHALSLVADKQKPPQEGWMPSVTRDFGLLADALLTTTAGASSSTPSKLQGFGCVGLLHESTVEGDDACQWGIALHRTHLALFDGRILPLPASSVVQPDKYLYYFYAKVNGARMAAAVTLTTGPAPTPPPPHRRKGSGHVLNDHSLVDKLRQYLASRHGVDVTMLPPSLNVVVPTFRVDMALLEGICAPRPANQGTVTHVVVDNPAKVQGRVADVQRQLRTPTRAVVVHVNPTNVGVTSSRNRGIRAASGADWIVLQDDDVVPDPGLLQAYTAAIRRRMNAHDDMAPLGLCGMIHFPEPYNGFTAAMRMSGVPNAFEIAALSPAPAWGCTANVCMRNGPWLRFKEDWEKTGGGEDVEFFTRLQRDVGGAIVGVPEATVTHPWWIEGSRRAYWRFFLWGKGDGRLQKFYPEHCYRSWLHSAEMMLAVTVPVLVVLTLGFGRPLGPPWLATWWLCTVLAVLEVDMLGNVLADMVFLRPVHSNSLRGWARWRASMEAALVLLYAEAGRLEYHLTHPQGQWRSVGKRVDFYCGRLPEARRAWKKTYAVKFVGYVVYGVLGQWLVGSLGHGGRGAGVVVLAVHAALVAFVGSLPLLG